MRKYIVLGFGLFVFIYVIFRVVGYMGGFGSVEGQVYLADGENEFRILKNQTIFLVDGQIKEDVEALKNEYDSLILPLEQEYKEMRNIYLAAREEEKNDKVLLNTYRFLTNNTRIEREKELNKKKEQREKIYNKYNDIKNKLNSFEITYNNSVSTIINTFVALKATSDENGFFYFNKVEKGDYYVYSVYIDRYSSQEVTLDKVLESGGFMKKYVWFERIELKDNVNITLVKENLSEIYR